MQDIHVTPIYGGRNNRAYQIKIKDQAYFLKHYNKKGDKERDRLTSEYTFLTYAAACETPFATKPIAFNDSLSIGLYEFLKGRRYQRGEIKKQDVDHALQFLFDINKNRFSLPTSQLGQASEACFSIQAHVDRTDFRVQRLQYIDVIDDLDKEALNFVESKLIPMWEETKRKIFATLTAGKLTPHTVLSEADKIISPSDFGFHNALKMSPTGVKFVDFEYAGWDDPAKLIGDFFNQVEVPVHSDFLSYFTKKIAGMVKDGDTMLERVSLLLPLYKIKWICIVLNYFLTDAQQQKNFVATVTENERTLQLQKAHQILKG